MKKTSKVLLVLTLGIVISLVLVSAGCLSLFSNPSVSTDTSDTTKIDTSKIDTTKILTDTYTYDSETGKLVKKENTMVGKWKEGFTNKAYGLILDIIDESSAEYIMNIKSGKMVNEYVDDDELEDFYQDGDSLEYECRLVKQSDGSYSIIAKTCTIIRDGDELISGDAEDTELGVFTYDKTKDSLKITSEGETLKMVRTT